MVWIPWLCLFLSPGLLAPPQTPEMQWHAAQGVSCRFQNDQARCVKGAWGFELQFVHDVELEGMPVLLNLRTKLHELREDQVLLVLRARFINRSDRAMFLEPSSIWLRLQDDRPYQPMSIDEIAGFWSEPGFLESEDARWSRKNLAVDTIYIPPKHFTERYVLFRLPALGWTRLMLEVDPLWMGTEINRFRLWAERAGKKP